MKFTRLSKKIARDCSFAEIQDCYHKTEHGLKVACQSGDKKTMKKAMANHQAFEYALLYRQTPEFKEKQRSKHAKLRKRKYRV